MAENTMPPTRRVASAAFNEFASAQAQLILIGEAIRTAAADLVISPAASSPTAPQAPLPRKSDNASSVHGAAATPLPTPMSIPPCALAPSATAAATSTSTAAADAAVRPAAVMISATDRLAALHDYLRRVQFLMKEYEAVSQRAVEMHLLPTPAEDKTATAMAVSPASSDGQRQKPAMAAAPPEPPSPTHRRAASPSQPSPEKSSKGASINRNRGAVANRNNTSVENATSTLAEGRNAPAAAQDTVGPSLHQRRALASDATFTRFCGLRVDPEHLLLPWAAAAPATAAITPTSAFSSASVATLRALPEEESASTTLPVRPTSSCSITSQSSTGSAHSQASMSLRLAQQQRQQMAATAPLSAYSRFFLHPQSPLQLTPGLPDRKTKTGEVVADVDAFLSSSAAAPAVAGDLVNGPAVLLRQLRDTQFQFEALRRCRLFSYEGRIREITAALEAASCTKAIEGDDAPAVDEKSKGNPLQASAAAASSAKRPAVLTTAKEPKWEHAEVLVDRMTEVLTALRARFVSESHFAHCGTPAVALGRQLHAWMQPLLRQLNELLSNPTLEDVDQDLREKLRRMKFDVEELQQEQEDAIANGNMQRSEELYGEQTALSEAMQGPYDEMEQLLQEYIEECVTAPLAALQEQKETLTARLTRVIEEHASRLAEVGQDMDRVKEKRRTVVQSRHRQRNAMSVYQHAWKKQWQGNSDQQIACYRAMEQLEKRLSSLQQTQRLLADDWLTHMALERQREEDAAAFTCFAEARTQALTEAQRNLQSVVDGLRQLSGAICFSCSHAEAFAKEVLQGHVRDAQLALRQDRLAQFRAFYLTLGDWRFKKSRNVEEIQKKIEYYTLQQEVAMDVSNPKAKEYSQAKRQWEAAKAEALEQLDRLEERSRLQLEAFRPTEQRLRDAGVDFVSPEDELAQRNLQRTIRLVEYQQLIEEGIGVRESGVRGSSDSVSSASTTARATTSQHLPALPLGLAATTSTTTKSTARASPTRFFTADTNTPPVDVMLRSRENALEPARASPCTGLTPLTGPAAAAAVVVTAGITTTAAAAPTAMPSIAVSPTSVPLEVSRSGDGGAAVGTTAALPPISAKLSVPPQLHSTEERIMNDISKTASLGKQSGNRKAQKCKSAK